MSEKKKEEKDAFDILQESCCNCIDEVGKLIPQYTQSVTNLQSECMDACKKMTESSIKVAKEFSNATWGPGRFPSTVAKNANDAAEAVLKVTAINTKAFIAGMDAARENVRTFNDNISTFTNITLNMIKTLQSFYIPPRA